jgi:hypothetical protein
MYAGFSGFITGTVPFSAVASFAMDSSSESTERVSLTTSGWSGA